MRGFDPPWVCRIVPLYTEYIDKGYDQRLVDKRVYKFLTRERDTLTIKPTAIKYRYQKQQLRARK